MLERVVPIAVAAVCMGIPPAKLRKMMKAAGKPVGPMVVFLDAVEACDGKVERDENEEHRRMARLRAEK